LLRAVRALVIRPEHRLLPGHALFQVPLRPALPGVGPETSRERLRRDSLALADGDVRPGRHYEHPAGHSVRADHADLLRVAAEDDLSARGSPPGDAGRPRRPAVAVTPEGRARPDLRKTFIRTSPLGAVPAVTMPCRSFASDSPRHLR